MFSCAVMDAEDVVLPLQLKVYSGELEEKLKELLSHGLAITINSGGLHLLFP